MKIRKKYIVRRMTASDAASAEKLTRRLRRKLEARDRVGLRYTEFCSVNRMQMWSQGSVTYFLGSVHAQLGAGSFVNHCLHLKILERERYQTAVARDLKWYIRLAHEDGAQEGVDHADDYPTHHAAVMHVLAIGRRDLRAAAATMLLFGFRFETLTKPFRSSQIVFALQEWRVAFDMKFSKNRRSTSQKSRTVLTKENFKGVPMELLKLVCAAFQSSPAPFADLDYDELSAAVKSSCPVPSMNATPGSLRRAFVWTTIDLYTCKGVTDWDAVTRVTGHRRKETVMAHYQRDLTEL